MATPPIVIGGGILSINGSDAGDFFVVKFTPKIEVIKYNDYSTGVKRTGLIRTSFEGYTGSIATNEITATNMALYLAGQHLCDLSFGQINANEGGPTPVYTFTDVTILPSGETELVADDGMSSFQALVFSFEGTMTMPVVNVAATE
jgi:hypothetical protein